MAPKVLETTDASEMNEIYSGYLRSCSTTDSVWNDEITLEEQTTVQCYIASGNYTNKLITPMLNAGSTALPWEPYTGGQPSPSPEYPQELVSAGDVSVTLSDGGETSQTLTLTGDLPGIPVDSGGNYTDPDGQQWACNYRDWAKGVDVQMLQKDKLPANNWVEERITDYYFEIRQENALSKSAKDPVVQSNYFLGKDNSRVHAAYRRVYIRFPKSSGISDLQSAQDFMATHDVEVIYPLGNPIETPIPAEELAAYKALQTYDGTTNVTATDGAGLTLRYVADIQKYIDNKLAAISAAMLEG